MSIRCRILLIAFAAALLAVSAGVASHAYAAGGGGIVYAKGGNIFIARPDGKAQRRITRDGTPRTPYQHPTQADNGTIVALRGAYIHRFSRAGRRLGKAYKVAAAAGPLHELAVAPEVSPDGRHVAFYRYLLQGISDPSSGASGTNVIAVTVVWVNASNGRKEAETRAGGDYYENPSWIDNKHVLFFAPNNHFAPEVFTATLGGRGQDWFADEFNGEDFLTRQPLNDGEVSAAKDKLALIKGTNVVGDSAHAVIQLYAVSSFSKPPTPACAFRPPGSGPFSGPSWSPDGSSIAWSDRTGVWTSSINLAAGNCGVSPKLVARGGQAPDWSRASAAQR